ncbi:N-acetylmuramic acid 6-phosphate etherase [Staphylococcus massiliensis]|uniref:N-acetylmuramic acid 6-phosphate etherase n=1 Tax=Staphylococcus massiliensis TaxID=555791 RepID=UPI001EDD43B3|nr:N-acetylmuramic acid 6-phosphate etherase [Staphylococcus massiliensis]MCG3411567.1 N-acetylmuramic acid 6-phosphate etherase [Staphylococcus massiliensis]
MTSKITESRNQTSTNLDRMDIETALKLMNQEDQKVPRAIEEIIPKLTPLIEETIKIFNEGGRIIYVGAGTSGRLGVLDAAECIPTFNTKKGDVIGLIAGGERAMTEAVEGAEDNESKAIEDLKQIHLSSKDIVIGIAASGSTPYVVGGLKYASSLGTKTGSISCNLNTPISSLSDYPVEVDVGPEVLTGSTRLKAGTSQKLILNMISTITMVGVGKVYGNLMVDLKPTNQKLVNRSIQMIKEVCNLSEHESKSLFEESGRQVKVAIVMSLMTVSREKAIELLNLHQGKIQSIIQESVIKNE